MSLEEKKLLVFWTKQITYEENIQLDASFATFSLNSIESCQSGEFFLRILMRLKPDYFFMPISCPLSESLFNQIKNYLKLFSISQKSFISSLKQTFKHENSKWELLELIFFIWSISNPNQFKSFIMRIELYQEAFTLILELTLKIIQRILGKMDLQGSKLIENPFKTVFSTFKQKNFEDLIIETVSQKKIIHEYLEKNKILKNQLKTIKDEEFFNENNETTALKLNKIYHLEKILNKNDLFLFEKNREIVFLKKNREKLLQEAEESQLKIIQIKNKMRIFGENRKKAKNVEIFEEKIRKCKNDIQRVRQEIELIRENSQSNQKRNKEITDLEKKFEMEKLENSILTLKIAEMTRKYESLHVLHCENLSEIELVKKF